MAGGEVAWPAVRVGQTPARELTHAVSREMLSPVVARGGATIIEELRPVPANQTAQEVPAAGRPDTETPRIMCFQEEYCRPRQAPHRAKRSGMRLLCVLDDRRARSAFKFLAVDVTQDQDSLCFGR